MGVFIRKEIIDNYYNSMKECVIGAYMQPIEQFKRDYPQEYKSISSMSRKRNLLRQDIRHLQAFNKPLYWFTLTFCNDKDKNNEQTKRKEAFSFLNTVFDLFVAVEEYGEKKGRYHIHGFAIFKENKTFEDFKKWHSRQNLILLDGDNINTKVKYLTNYSVKDVPRIRRNKAFTRYLSMESKKHCARYLFKCPLIPLLNTIRKTLQANRDFLSSLQVI